MIQLFMRVAMFTQSVRVCKVSMKMDVRFTCGEIVDKLYAHVVLDVNVWEDAARSIEDIRSSGV